MKHLTKLAALVAMLAIGAQALGQDDRAAQAQEKMEQTIKRLDLTDEQTEQVKPILEDSRKSRQSIMAKYGVDPEDRGGGSSKLGPRQLRAMRTEIDSVQADANAKLKKILSAEQFKELEAIQQEGRDQMRERMRSSR